MDVGGYLGDLFLDRSTHDEQIGSGGYAGLTMIFNTNVYVFKHIYLTYYYFDIHQTKNCLWKHE